MTDTWFEADWPAPPGIVAGCSYRHGGVSIGRFASLNLAGHVGDDTDAVTENRRRLRAEVDLPAEPAWLQQVHGAEVCREPTTVRPAQADAAITRRRGVVCAVLTADCLPVLVAAADGGEVAAAHAGWRGLCAGVLETVVGEMAVAPETLLAWLGPAISQAAYEVGPEVRAQFVDRDPRAADCFVANQGGRWQADLYALARQRLAEAGVRQVFGGNRCTHAEADRFFSYRRDGQCGRMASFIFRRLN